MDQERRESKATTKITRRHPLVGVLIAFSLGIVADRVWGASLSAWWVIAASALGGWWCLGRREEPWNGWPRALILLVAISGLGAGWHHARWNLFRADDLSQWATVEGQPVCVEVIATAGPRWRPAPPSDPLRSLPPVDSSDLAAIATAIRDGSGWRSASGVVLVRVSGQVSGVGAGDRLRVYGRLLTIEAPLNPGESDFSLYARSQRRLCQLSVESPECLEVLERGSRRSWRVWLSDLRSRCQQRIERHVAGPRCGLALAILLGARERLDAELTEAFFLTGTVHLLAISGMNVGILAYGCWAATRLHWLGRCQTLWAASVLIVVYAAMTDAEPPVLRAAVFVVIVAWGKLVGRASNDWNTLAAAGLVVLIVNPCTLFQIGTQLSFLAVAVLARLGVGDSTGRPTDSLDRLIDASRPWPVRWLRAFGRSIWQMTLVSFVVWLLTTPLVWYQFHLISPSALPLNLLVWIPMAVAMYSGFLVLTLGDLIPWFAGGCGWLCDLSLAIVLGSIRGMLEIPGNHYWRPGPPGWWVLLFYLGAAVVAWRPPMRKFWFALLLVGWFLGAWLWSPAGVPRWWQNRQREVRCTFLAVGHGECVVVEMPGGTTWLYDAGRLGNPEAAVRSIAGFLWSRGITRLDAIVISHADADHFNAIPGLLERFSVAACHVSPAMFRQADPALAVLSRALMDEEIPVYELKRGDILAGVPSVRATVLHPEVAGTGGHDNGNSLVLLLEYAGRRVLLTGDLEGRGLELLLRQSACPCDVLQAPHHGSPRSSSPELSTWAKPRWVIVSGDRRYPFEALRTTYTSPETRLLHTARDGAIEVRMSDDGNLRISTWRPSTIGQEGH